MVPVPGGHIINAQKVEMESLVSRIDAVCPEWHEAAMTESARRSVTWRIGIVRSLRSVYNDIIAGDWRPGDVPEA